MFTVTVVLARMLETEDFGIYVYAYTLVQVFSIIALLGLPTLVVRELAVYRVQNRWEILKGLIHRGLQIPLVVSMIIGISTIGGIWLLSNNPLSETAITLQISCVLLVLLVFCRMLGATLRGLHGVVQGQMLTQVIRPLGFLSILGCVSIFVSWDETTPSRVVLLHSMAFVITLGIGLWMLRNAMPSQCVKVEPIYETKRWLHIAIPFMLIAGLHAINGKIDIIMLGFYVEPEDIAVYRIALQMSELVIIGLQAMDMMVSPRFSKLYVKGNMERLQKIVTSSARIMAFVATPIMIVLLLFGQPLLAYIFGGSYEKGYIVLIILVVGQTINALMGSASLLLNMTGNEQVVVKTLFISVVLNIVLNIVLIPLWHIEGAAVATIVSMIMWNIVLCISVKRFLGINSTAFAIRA